MNQIKITDKAALKDRYGEPSALSKRKGLARLDKHCRAFIAASPLRVIGSSGADGADVSPKGDAPGFVAVLDDSTLLVPDRLGNNRVDTLANILENPNVALIFFVPGMNETLRLNGTAEITTEPALLEPMAVKGKVPRSGILVHIDHAFLHCAKALLRSKFWDPDTQIDRKSFPSLGRMLADQIEGVDVEAAEAGVEESYKNRLY